MSVCKLIIRTVHVKTFTLQLQTWSTKLRSGMNQPTEFLNSFHPHVSLCVCFELAVESTWKKRLEFQNRTYHSEIVFHGFIITSYQQTKWNIKNIKPWTIGVMTIITPPENNRLILFILRREATVNGQVTYSHMTYSRGSKHLKHEAS